MNQKLNIKKVIPIIFVFLLLSSCCNEYFFKGVVVREEIYRSEQQLPLDSTEIDSILFFIAAGGINLDDGIVNYLESEHFSRFLAHFKEHQNLKYSKFKNIAGLEEFIETQKPIKNVIDSRAEDGPELENRFAYRYKDFWFVFIVDSLYDEKNFETIPEDERFFSRLIVMKTFDRENKSK